MPNYYIFRSSNRTHQECLDKMLVGQRDNMSNYVKNVVPGDIIFIHNVNSQYVVGPFWAVSKGTRNLEPRAWNGDFPWQVRIESKGKTSLINSTSFKNFGLLYAKDDTFLTFQIPNGIGKKLMEEMGFEVDIKEKKIIDHNPIEDVDIDIRLRYPAKYRCIDGHYVRSKSEVIIDDWLFNHNIAHGYEKKVKGFNIICDFYIRNQNNEDIFVEVWGLDDPEYKKRKSEKEEIYKQSKLKLISLNEQSLHNIDDVLEKELTRFDIIV